MRIIGETDHMDIVLDTEKKEILVIQKWKYDWLPPFDRYHSEWEPHEQYGFLRDARDIIQRLWSHKVCFMVKPASEKRSAFTDHYAGVEFNVRYIGRTLGPAHSKILDAL